MDEPDDDDALPPSKSSRKRAAHAMQKLGEHLVSMREQERAQLPLLSDRGGALLAAGDLVYSAEFDAWAEATIADGNLEALFDFLDVAPHGREAHPRTEHFAPLFVAMGAAVDADGKLTSRSVIDGFWYGLSKRSWQFS